MEQGDPSRKIMEIPADGEVEGIPWNPLEWKILGGGVKLEKKPPWGYGYFLGLIQQGTQLKENEFI